MNNTKKKKKIKSTEKIYLRTEAIKRPNRHSLLVPGVFTNIKLGHNHHLS